MFQVFPTVASKNTLKLRTANIKFSPQILLRHAICSKIEDLMNLFFRQQRPSVGFSSRWVPPIFFIHIFNIVSLGAKKKMFRVKAKRIVALVAGFYFRVVQIQLQVHVCRESVNPVDTFIKSHYPVTTYSSTSSPLPTLSYWIYFSKFKKVLNELFFSFYFPCNPVKAPINIDPSGQTPSAVMRYTKAASTMFGSAIRNSTFFHRKLYTLDSYSCKYVTGLN